MRIGFFGGSFDPPHLGHARIAKAAADRLHLDRVLLAPVALQPLKRDVPGPASWLQRLAMLRLMLADLQSSRPDPQFDPQSGPRLDLRFEASELDAPRADTKPNYTYDTLTRLRQQLARESAAPALALPVQLFVILGADAFLTLRHWHRAADLLLSADWIVAARPGFDLHSPANPLHRLNHALPAGIHPAEEPTEHPCYLEQRLAAGPTQTASASAIRTSTLYVLPDMREDISATQIRAANAGRAESSQHKNVLSPSVAQYIRAHGLYR